MIGVLGALVYMLILLEEYTVTGAHGRFKVETAHFNDLLIAYLLARSP